MTQTDGRRCAWCRTPIPATMRADAVCCSTRCRQARHRFTAAVGREAIGRGEPLRMAYADPPYPGMSKRYYGDHPDYAGEVDHGELIRSLSTYDAWALSTSASALQAVLALCPPGVRVAAWTRGERPNQHARGPQNAWEPVIFYGGRLDVGRDASSAATSDAFTMAKHDASAAALHDGSPADATSTPAWNDGSRPGSGDDASRVLARRTDALVFHSRPRTTDPDRVIGAKPAAFCRWVFDLLGAEPQDEFTDIFAGSGGVSRAWDVFRGADA